MYTFSEAEAHCKTLWKKKGKLVTVKDATENKYIYENVGNKNVWVGGSDAEIEGRWVWRSSCTVTYKNWASGQPDNHKGAEHCMHLWQNQKGKWNDAPCASRMGFVCKKETNTCSM